MPWYKCELKPDDYTVQVPDAASLKDYIERHRYIMVEELSMLTTVTDPSAKRLAASAGRYPRYWVIPTEISKINDVERIIRAKEGCLGVSCKHLEKTQHIFISSICLFICCISIDCPVWSGLDSF